MTSPKVDDIGISRQSLENGELRALVRQSGWGHLLLDDAQLAQSLAKIRPPDRECWVFAYGSLMWNPVFQPVESRPATLAGFHRRFSFWIHAGRATAQHPGLMMGLCPGGTCRGLVLRMAPDDAARELPLLWQREMLTNAYDPRLLPVRTPAGIVRAIVFIANPHHPMYTRSLTLEQQAATIATAHGPLGRNRDYLTQTVECLRGMDIPDQGLERLHARIKALPA